MKILKMIMKIITKTINGLSVFFNELSNICFVGIMLLIVVDVLLRYILNSPILGAYEIVVELMLCGVFCAFAYAQMKNTHIHVTMLLAIMPRRLAVVIYALGELFSAGFGAYLFHALVLQTQLAIRQNFTTGVLKIKTVPSHIIVSAATAVLSLAFLLTAINHIIALFDKAKLDEIVDNWV